MAVSVTQDFIDEIYSGALQDKVKAQIKFNGVELVDADVYLERITIKSNSMANGSTRFALEDFISQEVDMVLRDIDTNLIASPVELSFGIKVNNEYEWVKMGIYDIQDKPTTETRKTTIKLRDFTTRLDVKYDASEIMTSESEEDPVTATLREILDDIGNKTGVTVNVPIFPNEDLVVGVYDNTINARQYVSWLASQGGQKAIINRDGEIEFIDIKDQHTWNVDLDLVESWKNGTPYEISKVVYEDGIRHFEDGDDSEDKLFIDAKNVYIDNQEQIENIYSLVDGYKIDSLKTGKILGNPAIDSWDFIEIETDQGTFKTVANNTLVYNGVFIHTFETEVGEQDRKENVTIDGEATFRKYAQTSIDNVNAKIELVAGEVNTIVDKADNSVKSVVTQYYLSTSNSSAIGGSWQDTAPTWEQGKHMWTRTKTVLVNDNVVYSPSPAGTLLEGLKGDTGQAGTDGKDGEKGTSVDELKAQYYLSTSDETQTDGEWSYDPPSGWSENTYLWTRTEIKYINPTSTEYITPMLDITWNELGGIKDNVSSTIDAVSNLTILTDEIITEVSETKTTLDGMESVVSQTSQTVDGLVQSIEKKGGNNLMENSVKQFGDEYWTGNWSNLVNTETRQTLLSAGALQSDNDEMTYGNITVPNGEYVMSLKYKKTIELADGSVNINGTTLPFSEYNKWTDLNHVFTVTSNTIELKLNSDTHGAFLVGDLGIYVGNIIAPYSPSPNEVHTGTVSIGGSQITIESNADSVKFKANPDGIRIVDINDETNIITEFTDKGTITSHIEAGSGQVAKLVFEDLGDGGTGVVRI